MQGFGGKVMILEEKKVVNGVSQRLPRRDISQMLPVSSLRATAIRPAAADQPF